MPVGVLRVGVFSAAAAHNQSADGLSDRDVALEEGSCRRADSDEHRDTSGTCPSLPGIEPDAPNPGDPLQDKQPLPDGHPSKASPKGVRRVVKRVLKALSRVVPKVLWLPLFAILTFGILLLGILPTWQASKDAFNQYNEPVAYPTDLTEENAINITGISLFGNMITIDPDSAGVAKFSFQMIPGGAYRRATELGVMDMRPDASLSILIGSRSVTVKAGEPLQSFNVNVDLDPIKPIFDYPFDVYNATFVIQSFMVVASDDRTNFSDGTVSYISYYATIPVTAAITAYDNGWAPDTATGPVPNISGQVLVEIIFHRSDNTKFFSIFILGLMWLLSLTMFVVTMDYVIFHRRDVTYEAPALAVAMLFALPFVRDVQPDVPPVGVAVDVTCFFWAMLLTAASCCILLSALFAQRFSKHKGSASGSQHVKTNAAPAASGEDKAA